jgi:two-component system cell cycle sensor histidine kinase/response regulator CckA
MEAAPASLSPRFLAPPNREVVLVSLLLVLIVGALLAMAAGTVYALSGVRAYVSGEALYSKSQKDAVHHLLRYAASRDPAAYAAFEQRIRVPLADGRARRELLRADADLAAATAALIEGENHPDDVVAMARLFRGAGWVEEVDAAIRIWETGDTEVERLAELGREVRSEVLGAARRERIAELLHEVELANAKLSVLEAQFSGTLGALARRLAWQSTAGVAGAGLALGVLGVFLTTRLLRRIQRSEAHFRSLVEHSHDAVAVLARDGRIVFHSAGVERQLGYADVAGRSALDFVYAGDREEASEVLGRAFQRGARGGVRALRMMHADGSVRIHEAVAGPLADLQPGGAVVVSTRDVTERRALERQLVEGQRLESLGRLAGGVAHDFNNLLTVILGSATDALDHPAPEHDHRERLGEIVHAAERAAGLTRQLLSFASRQIVAPHDFDLAEQLRAEEPLLRRLAGSRVDFSLDVCDGPATVRADPSQIEQVVLNLVTNARDAMPEGGMLRVSLERCAAPPGLAGSAGAVKLTVCDTGKEMDEEARERAFEPFFTTKGHGRGTGLGLPVCLGIVKQCGGEISFENTPGGGTTFTVLLPLSAGVSVRPPAPKPARAGTEIVLLVEDEPAVRRIAAATLRRSGYRVIEAASAADARVEAQAAHGAVDLLLTDVEMPGGGGRALASQLRAEMPEIRVLFVSGHTDDEDLLRDVERSRTPFLAKPFGPAELLRKVREVLDA